MNQEGRVGRRELLWLGLGLVLLSLVVFRVVLAPDTVLLTTDDGFGELAYRKASLPEAFSARWIDRTLAGHASYMAVRWTAILLWLLPLDFFVNWIHALDLALASVFLTLFLRAKGRSWPACILALLAAFWVGSNFTLTYAGHIGKFATLLFAAGSLWLIDRAVATRRWPWAVLAGGAVGAMFLEQADLALFFGLFWGAYALFSAVRRDGWNIRALASCLLPMAVVALLVGGAGTVATYQMNVPNVATMEEESPEQKWAFCTQWSWPPEECIDFIAPGFMGWRSGEPEGPYWGRMGRSAEWEATGQGFRNFKLESQYLGSIPVILCLWALIAAWSRRRDKSSCSAEVLFWGVVVVLSLLLAFGKYVPLYRLFYALPGMSTIRNPNKFLQVFQLALGIVAAYGLDFAFGAAAEGQARKIRKGLVGLAVAGGLMALWALVQHWAHAEIVIELGTKGWGAAGEAIASNRVNGLFHGAAYLLATAGVLACRQYTRFGREQTGRLVLTGLLLAGVLGDVFLLSRQYIKPLSKGIVAENGVTRFLSDRQKQQRLALVTQSGFYNQWLTYLLPYHEVRTFNVTQMPRMPADYKAFLGAMGQNSYRAWGLSGVSYLMGPAGLWAQIEANPELKDSCELVYGFNVVQEGMAFRAIDATAQEPGQHCIVYLKDAAPRYTLVGDWAVAPDAQVLNRIAAQDFQPLSRVFISPDTAEGLPLADPGPVQGQVGVMFYRAGRVVLQVSTDRQAILRLADKFTPDWKASVDGKPEPVRRCDFLFQGVLIPPGLHTVEVEFAPSRAGLWLQFLSFAVCLGAVGVLVVERRRND